MADAKRARVTGLSNRILLILIQLCSWPALFPVFRALQKFSLHAMNRTSAGFLPVTHTGERFVLTQALTAVGTSRAAVILDCGANQGAYSRMVLAESARMRVPVQLHMFEPSSHCCVDLKARFASAGATVDVHEAAVSNETGRASIYFAWPGAGGTSLSDQTSHIQGTSDLGQHAEDVATIALDDFCESHHITEIDLLKMDIEGAELRALEGATRLIARRAIGAIQFELGSAALPVGSSLYKFWVRYAADFDFYLVMAHGLRRIHDYAPDLECFYAASTFVLLRKGRP